MEDFKNEKDQLYSSGWQMIENEIKIAHQNWRMNTNHEERTVLAENDEYAVVFGDQIFESLEQLDEACKITKNSSGGERVHVATDDPNFASQQKLGKANQVGMNLPDESNGIAFDDAMFESVEILEEVSQGNVNLALESTWLLLPSKQKLGKISQKIKRKKSNLSPMEEQKEAKPITMKRHAAKPRNSSPILCKICRSATFHVIVVVILALLPLLINYLLNTGEFVSPSEIKPNNTLNVKQYIPEKRLEASSDGSNGNILSDIERLKSQQDKLLASVDSLSDALKDKSSNVNTSDESFIENFIAPIIDNYSKELEYWKGKIDALQMEQIDEYLKMHSHMPSYERDKVLNFAEIGHNFDSSQSDVIASYVKTWDSLNSENSAQYIKLRIKGETREIWNGLVGMLESFMNFSIFSESSYENVDDLIEKPEFEL